MTDTRPRLAIIGSGISGLSAAYFLHRHFDLTLFEADLRIGGHTNTRVVEIAALPPASLTQKRGWSRSVKLENPSTTLPPLAVDTGFIVFNDRTYPNFIRLLNQLGVASQASEMSFSVRCDSSGIEYCGSSLNTFFAQRGNMLRPSFYQFLRDFKRFGNQAVQYLESDNEDQTVGEFFLKHRYSEAFYRRYFLPMGSAIWSCPQGIFEKFPIRFICQFYHHHGLLSIKNRPQWRVICGGSNQYLEPLSANFKARIVEGARVDSVRRSDNRPGEETRKWLVHGEIKNGDQSARLHENYDHVVFACHADQALKILSPDSVSTVFQTLRAFPYQPNRAILHTDSSVLPKNRRAWAAWNYHLPKKSSPQLGDQSQQEHATVTYNMNRLQGFSAAQTAGHTLCVTLNDDARIDPSQIIEQIPYAHPIFSVGRLAAQHRHDTLIDNDGLSFCGAYWGNGFHEDGLHSALKVAHKLLGMDPWKAVSIPDGSNIDAFARSGTNSATACF